jgi:hypothetical protein
VNAETILGAFISACSFASAVWLAVRCIRWAKRGTKGGAMLVAIAFPNPDQPPPQQQVEEETRLKKDAGSGDPPE